jgi:hypothetical protein
MSTNNWAVSSVEKKQPILVVNYCYNYSKCTKLISDHEIPLAICLLKGISCVSTQHNTDYWAVSSGEKNTAYFGC